MPPASNFFAYWSFSARRTVNTRNGASYNGSLKTGYREKIRRESHSTVGTTTIATQ
jgi:hypothetical protein